MLDWVQTDCAGRVITSAMVIKWLIQTPYLRYRNERLFLDAVAEHNKELWAREARDRIEGYSRSQIELNSRVVGLEGSFGPEDLGHE